MFGYFGCLLLNDEPQNTPPPTSVFPIKPQYGWQTVTSPKIVTHTFGEGDAKVEQRYYMGPGAQKFVVNLTPMSPSRRASLISFWNTLGGPTNAFFYDNPNPDNTTTTRYTVIFDPSKALTWTQASDLIAQAQVTLVVIPSDATYETYPISSTVTRFPGSSLETALLQQTQEVIPLLTITPKIWKNNSTQINIVPGTGGFGSINWSSDTAISTELYLGDPTNPVNPGVAQATGGATGSTTITWNAGDQYVLQDALTHRNIASAVVMQDHPMFISDRLCTIGGIGYLPRLLGHQGISQQLGPADNATFQLGNADRVFTTIKNLLNLNRADVQFCLFHVGTQTMIQFWRGEIKDYTADEGPVFQITCSDSVYELTLPYPQRTITRTCWKDFNDGNHCPYASASSNHSGDPLRCDKGFDSVNGCQTHGMDNYFGGVSAVAQPTVIRDNSQSGRPTITVTSIVSDTMYGKPLQQVYTNGLEMPVNCIIANGRDEGPFYEAIGIVGEGPIGSFGATANQLLDGQTQNFPFSPIEVVGNDPEPWPFSLDAGGAFQYNYKAAGVARLNIRRTDTNGIQPSTPDQHTMVCTVTEGVQGLVWTAPGSNSIQTLSNPIWVAVNALLKAKGLGIGTAISIQEQQFDVNSAVAAAAICDRSVQTLVYNQQVVPLPVDGATLTTGWMPFDPVTGQLPNETQFQFVGVISQLQPLRDWLDQILLNCVGYWFTVFGKIYFGIRANATAVENFTTGNMLFKSYSDKPKIPRFNDLTASFADRDFEFSQNTARYYDQDYALAMGGQTQGRYEKGQINLSGTCTASQAIRVIATRGREEIGGVNEFEWKNAVTATWKTTVLSLNTYCGQVVSVTHPLVPNGYARFRIDQWVLNYDYSVQIVASTVTDTMYDFIIN